MMQEPFHPQGAKEGRVFWQNLPFFLFIPVILTEFAHGIPYFRDETPKT
jgi:hypothetical protein